MSVATPPTVQENAMLDTIPSMVAQLSAILVLGALIVQMFIVVQGRVHPERTRTTHRAIVRRVLQATIAQIQRRLPCSALLDPIASKGPLSAQSVPLDILARRNHLLLWSAPLATILSEMQHLARIARLVVTVLVA